MTQPCDPARGSDGAAKAKKLRTQAADLAPRRASCRVRVGRGACSGLAGALDPAPAVLPNQAGDPLLPLRIGIWDALFALLRPGTEPEALARALRAYTRSAGYFMACARQGAMRHDLDGRAVEPVSEEHRTGALKAVQEGRNRSAARRAAAEAAS
jgi:hypothetical protein